jgi:hypothetical protein
MRRILPAVESRSVLLKTGRIEVIPDLAEVLRSFNPPERLNISESTDGPIITADVRISGKHVLLLILALTRSCVY